MLLKVIILAVIQGITEFLPVSSSGHLGMAKHVMDLQTPGVVLEVVMHAGTLLAVLFYFRSRIIWLIKGCVKGRAYALRYLLWLAIGTLPIACTGLLIKEEVARLFSEPFVISSLWLVMAIVLFSLRFVQQGDERPMNMRRAIVIGIAQAFAILPGISRAGLTITAARHLGVGRREAAEFAFLLFIPAMAGALALDLREAITQGAGLITSSELAVGATVSAIVGYCALLLLVKTLKSGRMWWFGFYCLAAGLCGFVLTAIF